MHYTTAISQIFFFFFLLFGNRSAPEERMRGSLYCSEGADNDAPISDIGTQSQSNFLVHKLSEAPIFFNNFSHLASSVFPSALDILLHRCRQRDRRIGWCFFIRNAEDGTTICATAIAFWATPRIIRRKFKPKSFSVP